MDHAARRLIWMNGLWTLANTLSGLFTQLYLFRLRPGVTTPALYTLFQMLTVLFLFPTLGHVVKRRGAAFLNLFGQGGYALFYLTLLLLQDQAANYLIPLGILMGAVLSAYAFATHVLSYDVIPQDRRELFFNRSGVVNSVAGLLAPLAAGWLVASLPGLTGYRIIFAVSCGLFGAAAWVGTTLPSRRADTPYRLGTVLPGEHRSWHRLLVAYGLIGLRDAIFGFSVSLLVFLSTGGEASVGNYAFLTAAVGLGAFWLAARIKGPANRGRLFPAGAWLLALAAIPLLFGVSWWTLLLYGLLNAVATALWQTTFPATAFAIIQEASGDQDLRVEMIAAREIPLGIGRIAALTLFLGLAQWGGGSTLLLQGMLAALGLVFPLVWYLMRPPSGRP